MFFNKKADVDITSNSYYPVDDLIKAFPCCDDDEVEAAIDYAIEQKKYRVTFKTPDGLRTVGSDRALDYFHIYDDFGDEVTTKTPGILLAVDWEEGANVEGREPSWLVFRHEYYQEKYLSFSDYLDWRISGGCTEGENGKLFDKYGNSIGEIEGVYWYTEPGFRDYCAKIRNSGRFHFYNWSTPWFPKNNIVADFIPASFFAQCLCNDGLIESTLESPDDALFSNSPKERLSAYKDFRNYIGLTRENAGPWYAGYNDYERDLASLLVRE